MIEGEEIRREIEGGKRELAKPSTFSIGREEEGGEGKFSFFFFRKGFLVLCYHFPLIGGRGKKKGEFAVPRCPGWLKGIEGEGKKKKKKNAPAPKAGGRGRKNRFPF